MNNEDLLKPGESGFPIAFEQAMSIIMNELHKLVKPECLITILIRTPDQDDADICWTSDNMVDVCKMVPRCLKREEEKVWGSGKDI